MADEYTNDLTKPDALNLGQEMGVDLACAANRMFTESER
jgi:hypothetical protein